MTYVDILNHVFDNGRITAKKDDDLEFFLAEVEAEISFEASERLEAGELEGTVQDAIDFALAHV